MGYTVPVTVQQGDKKVTIGYADIESIFEAAKIHIDPAFWPDQNHPLNLSIRHGDVDIEEFSVVLNEKQGDSTC